MRTLRYRYNLLTVILKVFDVKNKEVISYDSLSALLFSALELIRLGNMHNGMYCTIILSHHAVIFYLQVTRLRWELTLALISGKDNRAL